MQGRESVDGWAVRLRRLHARPGGQVPTGSGVAKKLLQFFRNCLMLPRADRSKVVTSDVGAHEDWAFHIFFASRGLIIELSMQPFNSLLK